MAERTLIDWMFEYPGYTFAIVLVVTIGVTTSVECICRTISIAKDRTYKDDEWGDERDKKGGGQ